VKPTIPDFDWYSAESKRLRLVPRCPFANADACPRYFQSLSLLGTVGHTPISKEEDARLLAKWKHSPLWPSTAEQAASVTGPEDRLESLNNFCPEVAFDRYGYFTSHLGRYADEVDSGCAHERLKREGAEQNHPSWQWGTYTPQHFSACPLHAPLAHDWTKLLKATRSAGDIIAGDVRFDVFISHASEDKDVFVRELAAELTRLGLRVWYDEATLQLGDSLREKIDEGLGRSTFGVVVLSPSFFRKNWTRAELDALYAREMEGRKVILPIWHCLTKEEVLRHSPLLAGKLAVSTDRGVGDVAQEIFSIVRPSVALPSGKLPPKERSTVFNKKAAPLVELLLTIHDVAPLLHKLDQLLIGREARIFLEALQRFFHGSNILTDGTDKNLRFGLDNLLRVLASEARHPDYMRGKLTTAQACFEDFRKRAQIGHEIPEVGNEDVCAEVRYLHAPMLSLIDESASLAPSDRLCLRLIVAFLEFGLRQHPSDVAKRYPQIAPNLHQALREYLSEAFRTQLNFALPDPLENIWNGDIRTFCSSAWDDLLRYDNRSPCKDALLELWRAMKSKLRFRRVKRVTAAELVEDLLR
jgi:hypothetical protein